MSTERGDREQCQICKERFVKVANHVLPAHNITAAEYYATYGRPESTSESKLDDAAGRGAASQDERGAATPLEQALGVEINPDLLRQALTHRSYAYENGGLPTNERLEFLGDSVLGLVVTAALYRDHPDLPEGRLAKLRASVVNSRALAEVARRLGPDGLGPYLLLGKGEDTTGGRDKESILADTLEAILGAVYLEHGLEVAGRVVHRLFDPVMAQAARLGAGLDWKTSLQELTATRSLGVPDYHVDQAGPDHAKTFTAWAVVAGRRFGGVQGRTKKEAEQRAAEAAFTTLTAEVAAAELNGAGDAREPDAADRPNRNQA